MRDGKLRALAVTGEARICSLPDIPTVAEAALPGYAVTAWQALLGPAGLPVAIVRRLNAELGGVLRDPAVADRLRAIGNVPKPSTPESFDSFVLAETDKLAKVIKAAGVKAN